MIFKLIIVFKIIYIIFIFKNKKNYLKNIIITFYNKNITKKYKYIYI